MLNSQRNAAEPMIYARYCVPDVAWQFFVAEGEPEGADYVFFGLRMPSEEEMDWSWTQVRLSELMGLPGVILDREFIPATFPDAVVHPYVD